MNIDKIDLKLIKKLTQYDKKEVISAPQLAKEVLNPDGRNEMMDCNSLIYSKMKKLINYGIISKEKMNGKWSYYIDNDDVLVTEGRLNFKYEGGEKETELDNIIFLPQDDGIYIITFLPER